MTAWAGSRRPPSSASGRRLELKPSNYFRRQVWISGDPGERTLPAMMKTYGADRFLWASDYPHLDHVGDYLEALEEMVGAAPARAAACSAAMCATPSASDRRLVEATNQS